MVEQINPKLINRIQDRRGKTIYQEKNRKCLGCDKFVMDELELPKIASTNKKVINKELLTK